MNLTPSQLRSLRRFGRVIKRRRMATIGFKRYWAMTDLGIGLVVRGNVDGRIQVQYGNRLMERYWYSVYPASFWSDFMFRPDSYGGTSYVIAGFTWAVSLATLLAGVFGTGFSPEWTRVIPIAFPLLVNGAWAVASWRNFKRGR